MVPLAAIIFHSLGRHPLAGLAAAFAGVSGGYSANLLLGTVDPLLSGITQQAAQIIDPTYIVGAEANWYFYVCQYVFNHYFRLFDHRKLWNPSWVHTGGAVDEDENSLYASANVTPLEKKRYSGHQLPSGD